MLNKPFYLVVVKWMVVSNLCWIMYFTGATTFLNIIVEDMLLVTVTGSYVEYLMKKRFE